MAKKERRNFGRKTLATIMALVMVFGLVQVPVFAQGTAADPYDVGDIAYTANRNTKPEGEIPAYTAWEYVKTHSAQYDCGKEEHTHSRFCDRWGCNEEEHRHDDSCISVPARVEWKLGIDDNADSALHLDIHIGLKATYTLDGVPYTSDVQLTKEDYTSGRLQISSTAPFEITGTEIYDAGQRRFNGSFPVGTSANPVYYTIKLVKNVDFNVKGETVTLPMTFEKTVQFWSEDNICETILQSRDYNKWKSGLFIRGGMDFKLGASEAEGSTAPTEATLTIQKNVSGITLEAAKEYVFGVYSGNEKIDNVEVTVEAGSTSALGTIVLDLNQDYTVVEEGSPAIEGYDLVTSVSVDGAAAEESASATFLFSGDGGVVFTNTYTEKELPPPPAPVYYDIVVEYVDEAGNPVAAADGEEDVLEGTAYEYNAIAVEGYRHINSTGDAAVGTADSDKHIVHIYEKLTVYFNILVEYVDEAGNALHEDLKETLEENAQYGYLPKEIEGYTYKELAEGSDEAGGAVNEDKHIIFVYSKNPTIYTVEADHITESGEYLRDGAAYDVEEGKSYEELQDVFEGYEYVGLAEGSDKESGTVDGNKHIVHKYHEIQYYDILVEYVDEAGKELRADELKENVKEDTAYAYSAPAIEGYTFLEKTGDAEEGSVTKDIHIVYIYSKNPVYYDVEVKYVDEAGEELIASEGDSYLEGSEYNYPAKPIEGYTFKESTGDAAKGIADSDKSIVHIYKLNEVDPEDPPVDPNPDPEPEPVYYNVEVKYVDEAGEELEASEGDRYLEGSEYDYPAKEIEGYTFKESTGDAAKGIADSDKSIVHIYEKNEVKPVDPPVTPEPPVEPDPVDPPLPLVYTLIVDHVDEEGNALAERQTIGGKNPGEFYLTQSKAIEGYELKGIAADSDAVSGVMNSDKKVIYVYAPAGTDIPDEDVPLGGEPQDDPGIDIPDEDVPLADIPVTGDAMSAAALLSLISGAGFLAIRKKREDEE